MLITVFLQSLQAENIFEILNLPVCVSGTGCDLFPLRISDSLKVLVASWQKAESPNYHEKKQRKDRGRLEHLIQFKTAVKILFYIYIRKTISFILYTYLYSIIQWQKYCFLNGKKYALLSK